VKKKQTDPLKGSPFVRVIKKVNDPAKWRNEKDFQKAVVKLFQDNGWKVAAFNETGRRTWKGNIGWPDLVVMRGKRAIAFELKYGKNNPSHEQEQWALSFRLAGLTHYTCWPEHWNLIERIARGGGRVMPIELEPTEWVSLCERFAIEKWDKRYFVAFDREPGRDGERRSSGYPTFSAAVAWCEERAKQQQGGQSNV